MISVQEAKQLIQTSTQVLSKEKRTLADAVGYVLAEDVGSTLALPPFRQSSMDGYAVFHEDLTTPDTELPLVGESRAGTDTPLLLARGTTIRVLTGAPVPEGATAVVMKEKTEQRESGIVFNTAQVPEGLNVRAIGQQIRPHEVAMPANTYLTPGSVGFLAALNVEEVWVFRKPLVGILVTGDELVQPGMPLRFGQVYESSSAMLEAVLKAEGVESITIQYVADEEAATTEALRGMTTKYDLVLTTGGVSVGTYDFVGTALEKIGVDSIFYKVKQRPGKPLYLGRKDTARIVALPGNPAATLVCFYEYVLPAIRLMYGRTDCFLPALRLPITNDYSFSGERDEFLKAIATTEAVTALEGQESFVLRSFALANALIYLPSSRHTVAKGELVEAHLLPFFC
ncbi:molybdopterin molybdotransferase MoeA [Arundinibacter roseus]|uniref:Molybdopterin molybdenumtransferase n=1 Tax=Arundinibacter roseus TaxID=2070510 RepID=A0A4R4KHE0_9BACT|nr:gephyrin-like molybdotransferase Glp [Arundinibacter roseus]TDB66061.1 molybdopterin molybdenumtransferase MoeA [Arundinibacter roseus]